MLLDQIRATVKKYGMFEPRDKVIVGVSGGPDSCALLSLLASLTDYGLRLHVAHLDHKARPGSRADSCFVKRLCRSYHIPCTSEAIDVKKISRGSFEESARNARLTFLFSVARTERARIIALGHTANDQAETVLMRLIRGTGLAGLSAIAPTRSFGRFVIVRPLLETTREQIIDYLRRKKLSCRVDHTNFDDRFLRNDVRLNLIPLLKKRYNTNIVRLLRNTASHVAWDYDYLRLQAQRVYARLGTRIDLQRFSALHPSLQHLILRMHIERVKGDTRRITYQHIEEIQDLIRARPVNAVVDLPGHVSVVKQARFLRFRLRS